MSLFVLFYRLWNLESKTCVQEITTHRKKFDESIFDVAFHPSRPYIASAGIYWIFRNASLIKYFFQELMHWPKFSYKID